MERTAAIARQDKSAPLKIGSVAAATAAITLALTLALSKGSPAGPTQLRLPAEVTAANCLAVARGAGLMHKRLTGAALGAYYSAWVRRFANWPTVTRKTLFDAGIAVSVCMRAQ